MKHQLLFCLVIPLTICACSQKKSLTIDGTWKLIQSQTITGNSVVVNFPGKTDLDETKIWSGNHFMFIARSKIDTTVADVYGVGTYKLVGDKYEENIRIISYKPWEGTTIKMTLKISNDTLIQTYPVDDNGLMDKNWASIERYIKISK